MHGHVLTCRCGGVEVAGSGLIAGELHNDRRLTLLVCDLLYRTAAYALAAGVTGRAGL